MMILTFSTAVNFGAFMQALATQRRLEEVHGIEVVQVDPNPERHYLRPPWKPAGLIGRLRARGFARDRRRVGMKTVNLGAEGDIDAALGDRPVEAMFLGSDQVLNRRLILGRDLTRCVLPSQRGLARFGLAMSAFARADVEGIAPPCVAALADFEMLSFREPWLARDFAERYGLKGSVLPDPSFLFTRDTLTKLARAARPPSDPAASARVARTVVAGYGLRHWAGRMQDALGRGPVSHINFHWRDARRFGIALGGPLALLSRLARADTVASNSFHFAALGIILDKTVVVPSGEGIDGGARMHELVRRLEFRPHDGDAMISEPSDRRREIVAGMRNELERFIDTAVGRTIAAA